jgi:hypothetical protein
LFRQALLLVTAAFEEYSGDATRTNVSSRPRGLEERQLETGEAMRRILQAYEAGELITRCAWCERVQIDGAWYKAPPAALTAIDALHTLSHSICPNCALVQPSAVPRQSVG